MPGPQGTCEAKNPHFYPEHNRDFPVNIISGIRVFFIPGSPAYTCIFN
jgi:hypothetical protein